MANINTHHIVFAGGGTGGHLFPGLAVAASLKKEIPALRVTFVGSGKESERRWVRDAGYEYRTFSCHPLPRRAGETFSFFVENMAGYLAARRFLRDEGVAAVVGLGGFASVPAVYAAARKHLPVVLLEQNALPGKANRWLAKSADLICVSFEETGFHLRAQKPIRVTGNPVRDAFFTAESQIARVRRERKGDWPSLIVFGGSAGSQRLNENVPKALYKLSSRMGDWRVTHQAGENGVEDTRRLYEKLGFERVRVVPFLDDLPNELLSADLAICRAGGTTLAELAAAGTPALLVPYPYAADEHQLANAAAYAKRGAAVIASERLEDGQLCERLDDQIVEKLEPLVIDSAIRAQFAESMQRLARPNAADDVASLIWSSITSRSWMELPCPAA